jgi:1-acyl-sn-glycerol-3-phosphate acyltransferase
MSAEALELSDSVVDHSAIAHMAPAMARAWLPSWLDGYVDAPDAVRARFAAELRAGLGGEPDAAVSAMLAAYASAGEEYRLYSADPLARRLSRRSMIALLSDTKLEGLHLLRAAVAEGPCLLVCNHVSYADTQATDVVLARNGAEDLADALVAVAGPKVYDTFFRRMAAICLNTLKTAQSAGLSQNEAGLSPREVGRVALETVRQAGELMAAGRLILLYAEGSRTRTGRLQPFLRAVTRYCALPGVRIVPVAQSGTDVLFPVDARAMRPAAIRLAFGDAVLPKDGGARVALEETWRRIAALLPERQRPAADTPAVA